MNEAYCTGVLLRTRSRFRPRSRPHSRSRFRRAALSRAYIGHGYGYGIGIGLNGYTHPVHEMGIAIEVYRTSREAVDAHGGGRLDRVRLAVGELSAVEPDLLVYAWEAVVAETADEGAALEIQWCRANQYCSTCDETKERSEGSWLRLCPDCGMPLQVDGGTELDVIDLSFEADESVEGAKGSA